MEYNLPPFNEIVKRGFFEQTLLDFSKNLFQNPKFGLSLGVILNYIFIYSFCKSKSCFSIIIYIFLVYLIFTIILFHLSNIKRNK